MIAGAGRPIHVSEVTIAAPGEDARAFRIQAELARNIYRAWFSHPAVMGITWWNTVDGAGVAGDPLVAGIFTRDMEKKPVWFALDNLVNREWRTRAVAKTLPAASHSCDCHVAFLRLQRSVVFPTMNRADARFEPPALLPHPCKRNSRRLT